MSNNWNGIGLPPVGTKCIVNTSWSDDHHIKSFDGREVTIVMHDICPEGHAVAVFKAKYLTAMDCEAYHGLIIGDGNFRPIKSDRDKAIEEMLSHMQSGWTKDIAAELYDAGYRKTNSGE